MPPHRQRVLLRRALDAAGDRRSRTNLLLPADKVFEACLEGAQGGQPARSRWRADRASSATRRRSVVRCRRPKAGVDLALAAVRADQERRRHGASRVTATPAFLRERHRHLQQAGVGPWRARGGRRRAVEAALRQIEQLADLDGARPGLRARADRDARRGPARRCGVSPARPPRARLTPHRFCRRWARTACRCRAQIRRR